jgi:hypothetical protein
MVGFHSARRQDPKFRASCFRKPIKTDNAMESIDTTTELNFSRPTDNTLLLRLAGSWTTKRDMPSAEEVLKQVDSGRPIKQISFDANDLVGWDSSLLTFVTKVINQCSQRQIQTDNAGLPDGVKRLLKLATAVPEKQDDIYAFIFDQEGLMAGVGLKGSKISKITPE